MPAKMISVTNQKGGVGKTTTSLNLGAALSMVGKRVLLVDADPQGNLTAALGYAPPRSTIRWRSSSSPRLTPRRIWRRAFRARPSGRKAAWI